MSLADREQELLTRLDPINGGGGCPTSGFIRDRAHHLDVPDQPFDEFDHETHMRAAFRLAREAADRGDHPFGSVLVREDTVQLSASNGVVTEDDIRRHPELHLAHLACREFTPQDRAG